MLRCNRGRRIQSRDAPRPHRRAPQQGDYRSPTPNPNPLAFIRGPRPPPCLTARGNSSATAPEADRPSRSLRRSLGRRTSCTVGRSGLARDLAGLPRARDAVLLPRAVNRWWPRPRRPGLCCSPLARSACSISTRSSCRRCSGRLRQRAAHKLLPSLPVAWRLI